MSPQPIQIAWDWYQNSPVLTTARGTCRLRVYQSETLPSDNSTVHNGWADCVEIQWVLTLASGGGLMYPPWVFLSWTPHRLEHRAEIFHSLWGIIYATFGKQIWSGQVRSWSYEVIRGSTFDKISAKSWENTTWCGAIDLNGDSWCDGCQYMTSCDSWHCIKRVSRSTKVTWGHWPRLISQRPTANRHMFSGVSWGAKSEFVVYCSQQRLQTTSSLSLGQSLSFDQFEFWPLRRSQPARVMPFYLGALRMLNVATGYSNNTVTYSELIREHAGESFRSLRHIPTYAAMSV